MRSTRKIVMAALLCSLCCVATMVIKIPIPGGYGYANLGDCVVIVAGFMLSPLYGFIAAGLGSALADVFSGYVVYIPVTFLIKGTMALICHFGFKLFNKKQIKKTVSRVICALAAEILMVAGYYLFEGFLYGFIPSLSSVPLNALQGLLGIVLGVILTKIFDDNKIVF